MTYISIHITLTIIVKDNNKKHFFAKNYVKMIIQD